MALRTRKWGCALGIALLTAAVIASTALAAAALMRPQSARGMLRAIPMFPGASHVSYTLPSSSRSIYNGDVAQLAYQVGDPPENVLAYYAETLARAGWDITDRSDYATAFLRTDNYVSGIGLDPVAPWLYLKQDKVKKVGFVIAYQVESGGAERTEVTVELITGAESPYRWVDIDR